MTHAPCSRRTTPRQAWWRQHCTSRAADVLCASPSTRDWQDHPVSDIGYRRSCDPLLDVAAAMALLGFAVNNGWLYPDELDTVRAYFADTPARELAERILTDVHPRPHPPHPAG